MKHTIKRLAVHALASAPVSRLMSPLLNGRASIFMLHRFCDPDSGLEGHDPSFVRSGLAELRRRRARILSLDELIARAVAGGPIDGAVAFTMDDGFWDQGAIGAELFLEFDVPLTCFLITGLQDGLLWPWDDRLAHLYAHCTLPRLSAEIAGQPLRQSLHDAEQRRQALRETRALFKRLPFATLEAALAELARRAEVEVPAVPPAQHRPIGWEAARALERRGLRFGPHTLTHGIVSRMTEAEAREQLLGAWQRLQHELASPLDIYGWPTGRHTDFGSRDIAILREAGFRAAVATDDDYAVFPADRRDDAMYALRRFALPSDPLDLLQYGSWIERGKQRLRAAFR